MAASVFVGARPSRISISQAGADLKRLQVRALLNGLSRRRRGYSSIDQHQKKFPVDSLLYCHEEH